MADAHDPTQNQPAAPAAPGITHSVADASASTGGKVVAVSAVPPPTTAGRYTLAAETLHSLARGQPGKGYDTRAAEWKAKLPKETAPPPQEKN